MGTHHQATKLRALIAKHTAGDAKTELTLALVDLMADHAHEVAAATRLGNPVNVASAIEMLREHPDGERLLERAYRADPVTTSMELDYLGAHRVRGALDVRAGLRAHGAGKQGTLRLPGA